MLSQRSTHSRLAGNRFARERYACLREQLDAEIPRRTLEETLLLATWNIREFDSARYGRRTDEAMLYIAEIVSRFDIVAIQEVREDLEALDRLVRLLGPWWRYVCTDVTFGRPGNRERMAYVFDKRKVRFSGISGEIVVPPIEIKHGRRTLRYQPARQLARTPHICGFKSGDYRFMLCQVHIDYGAGTSDAGVSPQNEHDGDRRNLKDHS